MSTRIRWLQWALATLMTVTMICVVLCFAIYVSGARFVPDDIPASSYHAPDSVRDQYLAVEADGATNLRKLNPVTFWIEFFVSTRDRPEPPPPERILLHHTTRVAQFKYSRARTQGDHHLASVALAIKVSRQWTRDQAVNTVLAESGFRQDVVGIEAAAQFFFGTRLAELRPQESLVLIAMLKSPRWFDPICHRERFERRYAQAVEKLGETGPEWTASAALSGFHPIECSRR